MNELVHKTHCCIYHGCKYGNSECPVASGVLTQQYACEQCEWAEQEWEDAWNLIAEGRRWFRP